MKKYILTILSVICSITLFGQTSFDIDSLKLTFTVIPETNNYVEVKKKQNDFNNSNVKSLNIPATVTHNSITYTVTKIADNGFQQSNSLKTLTIPNTVTSIGNNAFQGCVALELVDMPNTVSTIGSAAFQECHKLHSLQLPSSLTAISDDLFHSCHNLNEIIIPEGIVSIGERAFRNTHDVKIIFLGCGNTNHEIIINSTAFTNCYNDDIEILCLNGVLNFKDQNGALINFGNNTVFHVPCGKVTGYDDVYPDNITINDANCVSVSKQSGHFCLPETWEGYDDWIGTVTYPENGTYEAKEAWLKNGNDNPDDDRYPTFVPRKPEHPFYIKEGHIVELNHSRHIYPFNSINKGVLKVNTQEGGQLIERDSLFFDEHYTLEVEYQISKVEGNVFITRNHHESTDITALLSNHTPCGDYRYENGSIRDIETRCLMNITSVGESYSVAVTDHDYYRMDNNNNISYYYGLYYYDENPTVITYNVNELTGTANSDGFWKETVNSVTYIKHNKTFNGESTTVTIDMSGDVTLHGTDYVYGHVKMHENLGGEIEIVVPATQGLWNFVGAPFNGYDLWSVKIGPNGSDVTIVEFDYATKQWSESFSTVDDEINPGEGFLAWPFYSGGIVFSTKRDYGTTSQSVATKIMEEDFALNNDTVIVEKIVGGTNEDGRWLALANPYPAKLCVNSFVEDNTPPLQDNTSTLQGQGVYVLTNDIVGNKQKFEFKPRTDVEADKYDLGVGQGFFVNVVANPNPTTITFTKSQLHEYDESTCGHEEHSQAKSATIKEFVKIVMIEDGVETELLFAQNPDSEQEYDIYDANKLFSMSEISEPYFVTDGIALVKEEVKDLPYYATMNVRSFEEKQVSFKAVEIPEGYLVSIIDGEEIISLNNGEIYTTNIVAGENSDRFKILFGSTVGLAETENTTSNIQITNNDRAVNIATTEKDLHIEVYNALGQKVYETQNHNFILNNLSAGAYMIKAYNKTTSQTTKVIIK